MELLARKLTYAITMDFSIFCLITSIQDLHHFSSDLAEILLKSPLLVLPLLDETLIRALYTIFKSASPMEKLVKIAMNSL